MQWFSTLVEKNGEVLEGKRIAGGGGDVAVDGEVNA